MHRFFVLIIVLRGELLPDYASKSFGNITEGRPNVVIHELGSEAAFTFFAGIL